MELDDGRLVRFGIGGGEAAGRQGGCFLFGRMNWVNAGWKMYSGFIW